MALVNTLKSSAQNFTTSWVDYGSEIGTDDHSTIALWLNIDINDTQDARLRILAKHTSSGADEYVLPIKVETATVVNVEDEYYEFIVDEDAKRIISFTLDRVIPFVQVQIQAGTVGASAGQVLASKYTLSS